jgi:hypothetical protein
MVKLTAMGPVALFVTVPLFAGEGQSAKPPSWEAVKRAVARHAASIQAPSFWASLRWWTSPTQFPKEDPNRIVIEGDLDQSLDTGAARLVHVRGNLSATLSVGSHAEVVVGGSIASGGRLEARGIAAILVGGDVDGELAAWGMTQVWVEGDFRGKLETGQPSLHLHVGGSFTGTVAPIVNTRAALLTMDIAGAASTATLKAIDKRRYTMLNVAVGTSDLGPGIHPLWTDLVDSEAAARSNTARSRPRVPRNGFVAVTGTSPANGCEDQAADPVAATAAVP